jgi:hypothetical protein
MAHYRLYFLNNDGHINGARDLESSNEEEAYTRAEMMSEGRDWELWQGSKVIAKSIFPHRRQA